MKGDPALIEILTRSLQLTITFHEVSKVHRRLAKRWKYKGLRKIFEKISDESGDWRWCLEGLLAKYSMPIMITLNAQTVNSDAPFSQFLQDSLEQAGAIARIYHDAYNLAESLDDSTAASKLCDLQEDAECMVQALEAYARQATDQGVKNWLAEMM